ncbi:hypothetical protein BXZ70DRAFT_470296 [Cristinia sonorae]|uniref:F-box domain-containing protein n=1 Tax=Cristinia sonorae TaxID=1940300 RepID=A0A8K0UHF9_9AGAR|nr:hypothetical protein BXZ70DRAFT_470296 [Cristinia sonorae]
MNLKETQSASRALPPCSSSSELNMSVGTPCILQELLNSDTRHLSAKDFEAGIAECERIARILKEKFNACLKINTLPDEILETIFWEIIDRGDPLSVGSMGVFPSSMVCRRWRDVTFSSARLWSYIYINFDADPATSGQLASRAYSYPVNLSIHDESKLHDDRRLSSERASRRDSTRRKLYQLFPHTKVMYWTFATLRSGEDNLNGFEPSPMPHVEVLDVFAGKVEENSILSLRLFTVGLPTLHTMVLHCPGGGGFIRPSELLQVLRFTSQLKSLSVEHALVSRISEEDNLLPAKLPMLRRLHALERLDRISSLLRHLDTTGLTDVILCESTCPPGRMATAETLKALAENVARILPPIPNPPRLNLNGEPGCRPETFHVMLEPSLSHTRFNFKILSVVGSNQVPHTMTFQCLMRWDYIRVTPPGHERPPIHAFWGALPHLRKVLSFWINGPSARFEVDAVGYATDCVAYTSSLRMLAFKMCNVDMIRNSGLLPFAVSLSSVGEERSQTLDLRHHLSNIRRIRFDSLEVDDDTEVPSSVALIEALRDTLQSCPTYFNELEEIVFVKCGVSDGQVASLDVDDEVLITTDG